MHYTIIEVYPEGVAIWDGVTKDKHKQPAGVMEIYVGAGHTYQLKDNVRLSLTLVRSEPTTEQEQEDGSGNS